MRTAYGVGTGTGTGTDTGTIPSSGMAMHPPGCMMRGNALITKHFHNKGMTP